MVALALGCFAGCVDGDRAASDSKAGESTSGEPTTRLEPAVPAQSEVAAADRDRPAQVLWITGDVLVSGQIHRSMEAAGDPARAFAGMLAPASAVFRSDGDEARVLVNLETPVARRRVETRDALARAAEIKERTGRRYAPVPLNAAPWVPEGLARAGFRAAVLANNHALDQKRAGLGETVAAVRSAGMVPLGAGPVPDRHEPLVIEDGGIRTAVFALFDRDDPEPAGADGAPGLAIMGDAAVERIARAAREFDAVIAVVHYVDELRAEPRAKVRRLAKRLVAAGAAVVAMHGPHVPAPVERVAAGGREGIVAWSLGNLVSDMGMRTSPRRREGRRADKWHRASTREGLVLRVALRPAGDGGSGATIDVGALMTWLHQDRFLVDNGVRARPLRFAVLPLSPCGPAAKLPDEWPEPYRTEMLDWLDQRRDHLLAAARLRPACPGPLVVPFGSISVPGE